MRFADHLGTAIVPLTKSSAFTPAVGVGSFSVLLAEAVKSSTSVRAPLTTYLKEGQIADALSELDAHAASPPPVFAADLETAREMFMVGMQTDNHVARFLILYSALMLLAFSKECQDDRRPSMPC